MIFEKFEDAIVEINGVTNPQFLKLLIDYADKKCTSKLQTFDDAPEWYRKVYGHSLERTSISDATHFLNIQKEIMKGYSHYKFKFPQVNVAKVLQIDLLKYIIPKDNREVVARKTIPPFLKYLLLLIDVACYREAVNFTKVIKGLFLIGLIHGKIKKS